MLRILHLTDKPNKSIQLLNSINIEVDVWAIAVTDEEVYEVADRYEVVLSEKKLDLKNCIIFKGEPKSAEDAILKFLISKKQKK